MKTGDGGCVLRNISAFPLQRQQGNCSRKYSTCRIIGCIIRLQLHTQRSTSQGETWEFLRHSIAIVQHHCRVYPRADGSAFFTCSEELCSDFIQLRWKLLRTSFRVLTTTSTWSMTTCVTAPHTSSLRFRVDRRNSATSISYMPFSLSLICDS